MKTAAAIIIIAALIGIVHKDKKHEPPPIETRPPIVISETPQQGAPTASDASSATEPAPVVVTPTSDTQTASADSAAADRIFNFGKSIAIPSVVTDDVLRKVADSLAFHSDKYGVDYALATGLIARESRFNPNAVSKSGAKGLGQLIDSTAEAMGVEEPFDIDDNLDGSLKYFRQMMDMWEGRPDQMERALASYLAGPRTVQNCDCVPDSSQVYITDILNYRNTLLSM